MLEYQLLLKHKTINEPINLPCACSYARLLICDGDTDAFVFTLNSSSDIIGWSGRWNVNESLPGPVAAKTGTIIITQKNARPWMLE